MLKETEKTTINAKITFINNSLTDIIPFNVNTQPNHIIEPSIIQYSTKNLPLMTAFLIHNLKRFISENNFFNSHYEILFNAATKDSRKIAKSLSLHMSAIQKFYEQLELEQNTNQYHLTDDDDFNQQVSTPTNNNYIPKFNNEYDFMLYSNDKFTLNNGRTK